MWLRTEGNKMCLCWGWAQGSVVRYYICSIIAFYETIVYKMLTFLLSRLFECKTNRPASLYFMFLWLPQASITLPGKEGYRLPAFFFSQYIFKLDYFNVHLNSQELFYNNCVVILTFNVFITWKYFYLMAISPKN